MAAWKGLAAPLACGIIYERTSTREILQLLLFQLHLDLDLADTYVHHLLHGGSVDVCAGGQREEWFPDS